MRYAGTLAVLFGHFATSYAAYYLDPSCDPYKAAVIEGMKGAFDLAHAASDLLVNIEENGLDEPLWNAQNNLLLYLFPKVLTESRRVAKETADFKRVAGTYESVLAFNTNAGNPQAPNPSDYKTLGAADVVLFCDYSRFNGQENKRCDGTVETGTVCDPSVGNNYDIAGAYTDCQVKSFLSDSTQVSSCTIKLN
jgi:hypothetical protein